MYRLAPFAALLCCASIALGQDLDPTTPLEGAEPAYPTVITPARLRQSLADVPASVSIITGETLRQYGIRSVAEALRLVPGMAVTWASGPDYRINYHGTNILSPRRMNVLVDGISVYRPAFSEVIWTQLPVVVENIDRIEVTRGPASAAYGPNSMLAVINIITRNARDVERTFSNLSAGTQSSREVTVGGAFALGPASVSLTGSRSRTGGYDKLAQDAGGHDSFSRSMLSLRSDVALGALDSLELHAAVVDGKAEVPFADDFQLSYPDRRFRDAYVGAKFTRQASERHKLSLRVNHANQRDRQSWRTCFPTLALLPELFDLWRANPLYAETIIRGAVPTGGTPNDDALALAALAAIRTIGPRALAPSCVTPNQDAEQWRTELELESTYASSDRLRIVSGVGVRRQGGESQTFLGGAERSRLRWIFGNVEARPTGWLTANVGGYYEHNSLTDSTFSPRVGLNFHITPSQTVRVAFSRGSRSPDIQEQRTNWTYTFNDTAPPLNGSAITRFYQSRTGPRNLVSERISSAELGYLLQLPRLGGLIDFKLFHDKLTSLISERTNLAGATPTNEGTVKLRGAEIQSTWSLTSTISAFLNYAYLDNTEANKPLERSQYSRHSGSVGATRDLGDGWRGSLAYFGASGDGLGESRYGRLDLTLSKTSLVQGQPWAVTLGVRRLDTPTTTYANGDTSLLLSRFNNRLQGFVQLSLRLP